MPDVELQDDGPDEPVVPRTEQHPALAGDAQAEIDSRTAEAAGPSEYRHTFTVDRVDIPDGDPIHDANKQACAQEAINRGLHPTAQARLIGSDERATSRRHRATDLTYAVQVVPSVIDKHAEDTVTPVKQGDEKPGPATKGAARKSPGKRSSASSATGN